MGNKTRNLIVDLGVVLLDLDPQRCYDRFASYGISDVRQLAEPAHKDGLFQQFEKGLLTPAEFRKALCQLAGKPIPDGQIDAAWNSFLLEIPTYKLDLLLHLRERYMVYLLSNTNAIHWEWIKTHCFCYKGFEATDFFDKLYLSFEMHLAKPDERIFQAVLADAGLKAEETFLIDDAPENCRTAQALGIRTYAPHPKEDWRHLFDKEDRWK